MGLFQCLDNGSGKAVLWAFTYDSDSRLDMVFSRVIARLVHHISPPILHPSILPPTLGRGEATGLENTPLRQVVRRHHTLLGDH